MAKINDMYWLWYLLCGGIAGWLSGQLMRGKGFGILGNILVGIAGALLGGFVGAHISIVQGNRLIKRCFEITTLAVGLKLLLS